MAPRPPPPGTPRGHLVVSGYSFGCHNGGGSCPLLAASGGARDTAKHPAVQRTLLTARKHQAQTSELKMRSSRES